MSGVFAAVVRMEVRCSYSLIGVGSEVFHDYMCEWFCVHVARGVGTWFQFFLGRVDGDRAQLPECIYVGDARFGSVPQLIW